MKKNIAFLGLLNFLLVLLNFHSFAQLPNTWTQKSDFGGTERYAAVGFSIGTKGYIGSGYDGGNHKDFWEYDPTTDTWSQKADFGGTARASASGFSIGNKGFIGCGDDGNLKKDFWEYDPISNIWTQKADFGGSARRGAIGFSTGTKGYIGTGLIDLTTRTRDFWEYNPATDSWTQKANVGGPVRAYAAGFSIGNKGYIGTGNSGGLEKDFWEYNTLTDTWTQKANFGGSVRFGAVGLSIGYLGYIGTGDIGGGFSNDFWEYNPGLDTWTQKTSFGGVIRTLSTGFSIGNKGYIGTGSNGINETQYKDFWEYSTPCIIPIISAEPENQTLSYGNSAAFTVVATNAVSYQWQEDAGSGFINITEAGIYSNVTTATLNISLPAVGMSGYKYRCVITDNCFQQTFTNGNATLIVSSLSIVITPNAGQAKVYGSSDPLPYTYSFAPALIGTDAITGLMDRVAGENVGTYAFTIGTLTAGSNYSLSLNASPLYSITPMNITVTANPGQNKEYGFGDPIFTYTSIPGLVFGDNFTGALSRFNGEDVGLYAIIQGTLTASSNYNLTFVSNDFSITPKLIAIIAVTGQEKEYGSADPTSFTYTYTPSLVGLDIITGVLGRTAGENAGNYTYTIGTLTAGPNYTLSVAALPTFVIFPKSLTIIADDKGKCYDGTIFNEGYTVSYSGFVNGEDQSVLSGTLTFGGTALTATDPGIYTIISAGLTSTNYNITYFNGTLIINSSSPPTISGLNSLCAGSDGVLYTTEPGFTNYVWAISYGGIITGGLNTNQVTVDWATAGSRSISVMYDNGLGCTTQAIFNVTVLSVPVPIISGESSVCSGSIDLVYTTQLNYSNYVWTVSPGGTISSNLGDNSISVNWTGSGNQTVSVDYTNELGCQSLSPTVFNVNVAPRPDASGPVSGPDFVCAGTNGVEYSVTPISNALSYEWVIPAGATIASGAGNSSIILDFDQNANSGIITVHGVNECGNGLASPDFNVQLNPVPVTPVITQNGDTLFSSAYSGNQWYLDGVSIPGATGSEFVAVYLGNYHVEVTLDGCSSAPSNEIFVSQIVSADELKAASFEIYPNPSHGLFNIKIETPGIEVYNIEICNYIGALIWKQDNVSIDRNYSAKVDLNGYPAGVYNVTLKNRTNNIVRKVIIMH